MGALVLNGVEIEDTFAEAFKMRAARVIVTAETRGWARTAATVATGYATSVIGCDAEAGIEAELEPADTPDGRPGASLLFFGRHARAFEHFGGYRTVAAALAPVGGGDAERVGAALVTAHLLPALRVSPIRGRLLTDDDDRQCHSHSNMPGRHSD